MVKSCFGIQLGDCGEMCALNVIEDSLDAGACSCCHACGDSSVTDIYQEEMGRRHGLSDLWSTQSCMSVESVLFLLLLLSLLRIYALDCLASLRIADSFLAAKISMYVDGASMTNA